VTQERDERTNNIIYTTWSRTREGHMIKHSGKNSDSQTFGSFFFAAMDAVLLLYVRKVSKPDYEFRDIVPCLGLG